MGGGGEGRKGEEGGGWVKKEAWERGGKHAMGGEKAPLVFTLFILV
jgi:hypothetical protein